MNRRRFMKTTVAAVAISAAAPAISAGKSENPRRNWGPWQCVHDRGAHACNGLAFFAIVKPVIGAIINPANFRLLDGSTPVALTPCVCGTCGVDIMRVAAVDGVWPLTVREVTR
jgi:hypothetical protein